MNVMQQIAARDAQQHFDRADELRKQSDIGSLAHAYVAERRGRAALLKAITLRWWEGWL